MYNAKSAVLANQTVARGHRKIDAMPERINKALENFIAILSEETGMSKEKSRSMVKDSARRL